MSDTNSVSSDTKSADTSDREGFIRDLYALVAFFITHPEIPVPWTVGMHVRVDGVQAVQALAEQFGVREYGSQAALGRIAQTDFDLPHTRTPINIVVTDANRYLP